MPWLAVPYSSPHRNAIMQRFTVNGIPHLKVFNPAGTVVDDNAVSSGKLTVANLAAWAGSGGSTGVPAAVPPHQHQQQANGGGSC